MLITSYQSLVFIYLIYPTDNPISKGHSVYNDVKQKQQILTQERWKLLYFNLKTDVYNWRLKF